MTTSGSTGALAGLRVFIAEDEFLILQLIEDMLLDLGCVVADSVPSVSAALQRAATTDAQVAVLDVNLRGEVIFPVAQALDQRGIPFIFSSGYGADGVAPEWRGRPVIQKPFSIEQLQAALERALA
jgi:CheY-like chemotaxis protein